MQKILRFAVIAVILAAIAVSCKEKTQEGPSLSFTEQTIPGVYDATEALFQLDLNTHQVSVNRNTKTFRIQNDLQEAYLICKLSAIPVSVNEKLNVIVTAKGFSMLPTNDFYVTVVAIKDSVYWLWDEKYKTGFIVDFTI